MANNNIDIIVNATDNASSTLQSVSSSASGIRGAMERATVGSAALLAGVTALGVASVSAFTGFDDSMRKVEATMGGKLGNTQKEVAKNTELIRDKAKEMGATTAFSASQAANAMEKLALAGWDTNQIISGIEPSLNLASASGLDLATSADILTDTMAAFGLKAEDATKAADIFAATSSSTNTDVAQLGEAMKYAGAAAGSASQSLSDTNAVLGYFANVGIKGSSAGTTFVSMMKDMKKNAKDGAIAIGETNVALYDSQGNMRSVVDIMSDVESATAGMSDKQRDSALSGTFMTESMKGVNAVLGQGSKGLKSLAKEFENSDGRAQEMAAHMEGGIGGAFRSLLSATEGVMIALGERLAPAIELVARAGAGLAGIMKNWISSGQSFGAVAAIMGGAILAGVVPAFYAMATAVWAAMSPLLPFLAVGAAVGALAFLIYNNWSMIANFFQTHFGGVIQGVITLFQNMVSFITPAVQAVVTFIQTKLAEIKTFWDENGQQILQAAQNVWSVISTVVSVALNAIMLIFQVVFPLIQAIVQSVWGNIQGVISGALDVIMGVIKIFSSLFTGDWQGLWDGIKQLLSGALNLIINLLQLTFVGKGVGLIVKFAGKAISTISSFVGKFVGFITSLASKVVTGFTSMFNKVISGVTGFVSKVVSSIVSFVSKFLAPITRLAGQLVSKFTSMMSKAVSAVKKGVGNIISGIKGFVGKFLSAGKGLLEAFTKGIKSGIDGAIGAVKKGMGAIRKFLPFSPAKDGPLSDLDKSGESFFPTWYESALKKVRPMERAISGAMGGVNDALESEQSGVSLSAFSGGKTTVTVVHKHEHNGSINVNGDNGRETLQMVGNEVRTTTENDIFSSLRSTVRKL